LLQLHLLLRLLRLQKLQHLLLTRLLQLAKLLHLQKFPLLTQLLQKLLTKYLLTTFGLLTD
jgi:hypothetical protein